MTRTLLYSVVVALSSTVCYLNSLDGEFAYDDGAAIVKNLDVSGTTTNLTAIWTHDFWGQQLSNESSHKSYRPLTTMTFRLDHQLHGGKPRPFHVFNLVCHVLVSLLVFFLCTHILAEGSPTWTEQELSEGGGGEERRGRKGEGKAKAEEKSERHPPPNVSAFPCPMLTSPIAHSESRAWNGTEPSSRRRCGAGSSSGRTQCIPRRSATSLDAPSSSPRSSSSSPSSPTEESTGEEALPQSSRAYLGFCYPRSSGL